jgi:glutamate carboxypeptidase
VTDSASLLPLCEAGRAWMLAALEALVRVESPSDDKPAVDRCVDVLAALGRESGALVDRIAVAGAGDHLKLAFGPPAGTGAIRLLLLGHIDTVWPIGTLSAMPVAYRDGALYGPGVYDMKAGLVIGLQAMRALGPSLSASVVLLATSDEEVGSATSRELIEAEARVADAVLVLEPALEHAPLPLGGVKVGRKGVGEFRLDVTGVPAHAGLEPEKGASAVRELARQLIAIDGLARPAYGTTINAGVVGGGTRGNVVAEHAWATLDVRVTAMDEARRVEQALSRLEPADPRITLRVSGRVNRPPLEPSQPGQRLYDRAAQVARALGYPLPAGSVGGASDGNFTAALGIPTIDGLGAVGGGAHARHEHVRIEALPLRAALVADLIEHLSRFDDEGRKRTRPGGADRS